MKRLTVLSVIVLLLIANIWLAPATLAHGGGHWNRYGSIVNINVFDTTDSNADTVKAVTDSRVEWDNDTILRLPLVNSHTDVSAYDGSDPMNVKGLHQPISLDQYGHGTHSHVWYNERFNGETYATKRGVMCQEFGHAWGLDHSSDGCMGLVTNFVEQHNVDDIWNKYNRLNHAHPLAPEP